ncbi:MAG: putative bifunctional diguanylate cyclase/phosphodiesterase [Actinomycetota bacterium]
MPFFAPGAVLGALVGTAVLVVAMLLLARSPGAPRSLIAFAGGFALFVLRYLLLMVPVEFRAHALIAAEAMHLGGAAVMAWGVMLEFGRKPASRALAVLWAAAVAWEVFAVVRLDVFAQRLPVALVVGGVMLAAAAAFWRRSRRARGSGWGWVAALFLLLGVHKMDAPWVMPHETLTAAGFLLTQMLSTALALALIVAADRERRSVLEDESREHRRILDLQGAAVAAAANAIFITDREGRIEWVNDAFTRLSGWSAGEAMGQVARRLLSVGDEQAASMRRMLDDLKCGRPWRGELELRRKDGTLFEVDQTVTPICGGEGRVAHYVVVQEDIGERRRAEERIRFLSSYDPLTALPNRLLFREHLQKAVARARAERARLAVLLLDLDDLSRVNDQFGHEAADRMLVVLVERLVAVARGAEMVARAGGDEFAVLLAGDQAGAEAAAEHAQALVDAMAQACELEGHDVTLGSCIGIAMYPDDGEDADTLIKNAEIAMYRAMREAPNGYRFFAPRMDAELAARRRLERELRLAVSRQDLVLHYQPQVAIADGRIVGFEALLRWTHAEDGPIPPARFIPLAEDVGLISALGEWVLREACRTARAWNERGLPRVPVAVNLSPLQLRRRDLPILVRRILQETGLPAGQLELELTEGSMLHDPEAAERLLGEVRALGVRLSIDDFGTGYSSLGRLKHFAVDKLKIDRSFVADLAEDPNDAAIARAIITLGHSLGLAVVSEGVETEAQLAYLRDQGCDAVQGWLYAPALPADEAAALLARGGF